MYPFFLVSVLPDLYSVNRKASDDSWSSMQYSLCTLRAPLISILIWNAGRTLPLYCPPSSQANNVNALYSSFCLPFNYYHYDVIKSSNLLTLLLSLPQSQKSSPFLFKLDFTVPNLNSIDYS